MFHQTGRTEIKGGGVFIENDEVCIIGSSDRIMEQFRQQETQLPEIRESTYIFNGRYCFVLTRTESEIFPNFLEKFGQANQLLERFNLQAKKFDLRDKIRIKNMEKFLHPQPNEKRERGPFSLRVQKAGTVKLIDQDDQSSLIVLEAELEALERKIEEIDAEIEKAEREQPQVLEAKLGMKIPEKGNLKITESSNIIEKLSGGGCVKIRAYMMPPGSVKKLAESLTGDGYKRVELSYVPMEPEDVVVFAKALEDNDVLIMLNLEYNAINEDALAFVSALKSNKTLMSFSLTGNRIGSEVASSIVDAIESNFTMLECTLEDLDPEDQLRLDTYLARNKNMINGNKDVLATILETSDGPSIICTL